MCVMNGCVDVLLWSVCSIGVLILMNLCWWKVLCRLWMMVVWLCIIWWVLGCTMRLV